MPGAVSPWWVYLVECTDGSLYCGVTKDLERRVAMHDAGRGAKYTRGRAPVKLVWHEACTTHGDALRREREVKALSRRGKERLVRGTVKGRH